MHQSTLIDDQNLQYSVTFLLKEYVPEAKIVLRDFLFFF